MNQASIAKFYPMQNTMQHYAWGSSDQLEQLFGIKNPQQQPQAEIWMGAHPNGCATVIVNDVPCKLNKFIESQTTACLGERVEHNFGQLPFLFKVLSAAKALSIQVHPNLQQAKAGYAQEEQAGKAIDDPTRNYKDPNHKPELIYALTTFKALNGFRPIDEIIANFEAVDITPLREAFSQLKADPSDEGLSQFFAATLSLDAKAQTQALDELITFAKNQSQSSVYHLINKLQALYPGDIGLLAPLLLNVITLEPGQAMFLYACTPHAYIKGTGLEIMANSDNVLRAGLTGKHIDVEQLLACCEFTSRPLKTLVMQPIQHGDGDFYPIPVKDFKFAIYQDCEELLSCDSSEIIFAIDQDVRLLHRNGETVKIHPGESVFIPAKTASYQLITRGQAARAYC